MGIFAKPKTEEGEKEIKKETAPETESKGADAGKIFNAADASKRKLLVKQVWITEKASDLSASGKYIFIVDKSANKPEIKKAVEAIYSVKVEDVNIINVSGKSKRLGRSLGKTSAYKKAIVSLKEGQKIDVVPA